MLRGKNKYLLIFPLVILLLIGFFVAERSLIFREPEPVEPVMTVGLSMHFMRDDYTVHVVKGFEKRMEEAGVRTIVVNAMGDPKKQVADIEGLVDQKVSAIGICPLDEVAVRNSLIEAQNKGITVVTITDIPDFTPAAVINGREFENGFGVGEILAERLGGRGDIVIFDFPYNVSRIKERIRGLQAAIEDTDINIIYGGRPATNEDTMDTVKKLLEENPDIKGLFAPYSNQLIGAGAACKALERPDIVVVGIDAEIFVINLILEGWIEAAAAQFPDIHGQYCAEAILNSFSTDAPRSSYDAPYMIVDRDNAVHAAEILWDKNIQ